MSKIMELRYAIEALPCSEQATKCSILATEINQELDQLRAELKQVKANHADMVKRNRELRDRPDLGDRAASVDALYKELSVAREELGNWKRVYTEMAKLGPHVHLLNRAEAAEAKCTAMEKVVEAVTRVEKERLNSYAWVVLGDALRAYEEATK